MGHENKSGCLKALLFFLLIVISLVAVGAYLVWHNYGSITKVVLNTTASGIETGTEEMLKGLKYPPQEIDRAMAPVREFAEKVRTGQIDAKQGYAVTQRITTGPVIIGVILRGFETIYVRESKDLSDAEKIQAKITISRFLHGISHRLISEEESTSAISHLQESDDKEKTSKKKFKKNLTAEDIRGCLVEMKAAADKAGIEEKEFPFDLAKEIEKALKDKED